MGELPPGGDRRGRLGRLFGSVMPVREMTGLDGISEGARLIGDLQGSLGQPRGGGPGLIFLERDGRIDVTATAFSFGVTPQEILLRVVRRQHETRRHFLLAAALAAACTFGFLLELVAFRWPAGVLLPTLEAGALIAAASAFGVKFAWQNWQLRTMRLGRLGEFLSTPGAFLPR